MPANDDSRNAILAGRQKVRLETGSSIQSDPD